MLIYYYNILNLLILLIIIIYEILNLFNFTITFQKRRLYQVSARMTVGHNPFLIYFIKSDMYIPYTNSKCFIWCKCIFPQITHDNKKIMKKYLKFVVIKCKCNKNIC